MPLTSEQLLKPRYKLISDYPGNKHKLGEVLHGRNDNMSGRLVFMIYIEFETWRSEEELDKYGDIFKLLQWWEYRKLEDLPEYVKKERTGQVFKVDQHLYNDRYSDEMFRRDQSRCICMGMTCDYSDFLPATIEEYEQYQSSLK